MIFLDFSDSDASYEQGLAASILFIISLVMHLHYLPYADNTLNRIEGFGLIVSTTTLYLGLWTFSKTMSSGSQLFVTIIVLLVNIMWLGYTINFIRKGYSWNAFRSKLCRYKEASTSETELTSHSSSHITTSNERINPVNKMYM